MCKYRSGVVVKIDGGVKVYTLPGQDSHADIREHFHITDDHSGLGHSQCPVEYVPRGELWEYDKYELVYDDGRPEWITEDVEADIIRQMWSVLKEDDLTHWAGYLDLSGCTGITTLGDLQTVGGYLDLSGTGITSLGDLQTVGGSLNLSYCTCCTGITSLGDLQSVGGYLDLSGTKITDVPETVKIGGSIYK